MNLEALEKKLVQRDSLLPNAKTNWLRWCCGASHTHQFLHWVDFGNGLCDRTIMILTKFHNLI